MPVPAAVRQAIQQFAPADGFVVVPPSERESSIMYDYGVRVSREMDGKLHYMWVCLASEACRSESVPIYLSNGKTSAATKHLKANHNLSSEKTLAEETKKRTRDDKIEHLKNSDLYKESPQRLNLLLETSRIINNNLPFKFGEYEESMIIRAVCSKDHLITPINYKMVRHTIVEMYVSAKLEIKARLDDAKIGDIPYLVL